MGFWKGGIFDDVLWNMSLVVVVVYLCWVFFIVFLLGKIEAFMMFCYCFECIFYMGFWKDWSFMMFCCCFLRLFWVYLYMGLWRDFSLMMFCFVFWGLFVVNVVFFYKIWGKVMNFFWFLNSVSIAHLLRWRRWKEAFVFNMSLVVVVVVCLSWVYFHLGLCKDFKLIRFCLLYSCWGLVFALTIGEKYLSHLNL